MMEIVNYVCLIVITILCLSHLALTSVKKGGAVGPSDYLCGDLKVMDSITWWYDWSLTLKEIKKDSGCANIEQFRQTFIPMIWGKHSAENATIYEEVKYVLGFNEPNHKKGSNITAAEAAAIWPEVERVGKGKILVSPSASGCNGGGSQCHGDAQEWFDEFFQLCTGCRVDYIATHAYHCNADTTMNYLKNIYQRYGKEIWFTEFACPNTDDPEKELEYMKEILPRLEAAPYIFRYSWFEFRLRSAGVFVSQAASLFKSNTSELTPLGQYYNNFTGETTGDSSGILSRLIHIVYFMFSTFNRLLW
ncbi:hypothetical protein ACF0H5_016685 [Mactra antiquata]